MVISLNGTKLSYCHSCMRPSMVMEMVVKDWGYSFFICNHCIKSIQDKITEESMKIKFNQRRDEE